MDRNLSATTVSCRVAVTEPVKLVHCAVDAGDRTVREAIGMGGLPTWPLSATSFRPAVRVTH